MKFNHYYTSFMCGCLVILVPTRPWSFLACVIICQSAVIVFLERKG